MYDTLVLQASEKTVRVLFSLASSDLHIPFTKGREMKKRIRFEDVNTPEEYQRYLKEKREREEKIRIWIQSVLAVASLIVSIVLLLQSVTK